MKKITALELFEKIEKGDFFDIISFKTISDNLLITEFSLVSYFDIYIMADSFSIIKNARHLDLEFYKNDLIVSMLTILSNEKIVIKKTKTGNIELKKELL